MAEESVLPVTEAPQVEEAPTEKSPQANRPEPEQVNPVKSVQVEQPTPSKAATLSAPTVDDSKMAQMIQDAQDKSMASFAKGLGFDSPEALSKGLNAYRQTDEAQAESEASARTQLEELQKESRGQVTTIAEQKEQIRVMHENQLITRLVSPAGLNFKNPDDAIRLVDRSKFSTDDQESYDKSVKAQLKLLAKEKDYLINKASPLPTIDSGGDTSKKVKNGKSATGAIDMKDIYIEGFRPLN
jgi:hypothetical protein